MPRNVETYLADIQLAIDAIEEYSLGQTLESFEQTRMLRSAIRGELMVIGEAVSQMLQHFPEASTKISLARRIVDFRNLLIHEYGEVDDKIVWSIIITSLPVLKAEVQSWMVTLQN